MIKITTDDFFDTSKNYNYNIVIKKDYKIKSIGDVGKLSSNKAEAIIIKSYYSKIYDVRTIEENYQMRDFAKIWPDEKINHTFHGQCLGCKTPLKYGIGKCINCKFFNFSATSKLRNLYSE